MTWALRPIIGQVSCAPPRQKQLSRAECCSVVVSGEREISYCVNFDEIRLLPLLT